MTAKGENDVKKTYSTPRAEKLSFDYKKVVVASGSTICSRTNDQGNGHGCLKPGHAHYNDIV